MKLMKKVCFILVIYIVIGCIVPFFNHKYVDAFVEQSFSSKQCYSENIDSERVMSIDDNFEALLWRIRIIESAKQEIILSTFDFDDDESGKDIMSVLLHAADNNVQVKIIIDGLNGMLKLFNSDYFNALLTYSNVEAKLYNPIHLLKPWKLNLRLHDKYLIVDKSAYILGGRNTNNLFLGNYTDDYNIDRDLLVYETDQNDTSNSLYQLQNYFSEIWSLPSNQIMNCHKTSHSIDKAKNELSSRYQNLQNAYPQAFTNCDFYENTMPTNQITLLTNPKEAVNKTPDLWYMLNQIMQDGKNVIIQTPYIICGKEMYDDLAKLSHNRNVELIINAVESGANPFGCVDYLNQKERIQNSGLETYEFLGNQSLHTKTILVDNRISIVGSYNLDMRSTYLDTELMLVVDSMELNQKLNRDISQEKDRSKHVCSNGTYEYGSSYKAVELSFLKEIIYGILRVVTLPIRHLL